MKKYILFLLLALSLFSCNKQSEFEKRLVKSKWVLLDSEDLKGEFDEWPSGYCRFLDDGSYKNFDITGSEMPFINNDGSERKEPFLWSYDSDEKVLMINNHKLKVLSIEEDTIRMANDTFRAMLYNIDKTHAKLKKGPGRCLGGKS